MTAPNGSSPHDALSAVRRLERALEERIGNDAAESALNGAREEAQRLLADARAAGDDEGRRRRAALLAAADAEATIDMPLDHESVQQPVARWQPYAGVVYFHLLVDSLSRAGLVAPIDQV
jgi:hypothetical protein